jgi:hypothetical protein
MMEIVQTILTLIALSVSVFALGVYFIDRQKIDPAILQTFADKTAKSDEYLIRASISNEGAKKADECDVAIEIGGNIVDFLDHVPVDSLKGRIGVDWPKEKKYALYPKRPIWVRGYVQVEPNTQIAIILRRKCKECDRQTFSLPKINE